MPISRRACICPAMRSAPRRHLRFPLSQLSRSMARGARGADGEGATFEHAAIGIAHAGLDGRWLRVNPKFCEILGYSREELLHMTIADLTYPADMAVERPLLQQLATGIIPILIFEKRYVCKSGTLIWVRVIISLMRDPQGAPAYLIGVVEDISARKGVEAALEEQTQRLAQAEASASEQVRYLEAVIDAITDGVIIANAQGQTVFLNQVAQQEMGILEGAPAIDLFTLGHRLLIRDTDGHPLSPEHWPLLRYLQGETQAGPQAADVQMRSLQGEDFTVSITGGPITDNHGQVIGAVMCGRNVTVQRHQERQRQEALNAVFDLGALLLAPARPDAPSLSSSLLKQIAFIFPVHSAALLRFVAADQPWEVLATIGLTPDQIDWLHPTSIHNQQVPIADLQQRWREGETMILDRTRPPFTAHGAALGIAQTLIVPLLTSERFIGILWLSLAPDQRPFTPYEQTLIEGLARFGAHVLDHDRLLQEREAARAQVLALEATTRRMDEFLGIASHELRTPVTSLQGSWQLLTRRLGKLVQVYDREPLPVGAQIAALHPLLDAGESAFRRLNRLIDELLEMTRIHAGTFHVHMRSFDLATLVGQVVATLQVRWVDRQVIMKGPTHPLLVVSDADRVQQVLENFLTNAFKYAHETEPITVVLEEGVDQVRVAVQDRGPGLTPDQQERIWERFYRVEGRQPVTGSEIGLGLGLFIARTAIERLGGQVGVESAPGQGSTFWFTLPRSS